MQVIGNLDRILQFLFLNKMVLEYVIILNPKTNFNFIMRVSILMGVLLLGAVAVPWQTEAQNFSIDFGTDGVSFNINNYPYWQGYYAPPLPPPHYKHHRPHHYYAPYYAAPMSPKHYKKAMKKYYKEQVKRAKHYRKHHKHHHDDD